MIYHDSDVDINGTVYRLFKPGSATTDAQYLFWRDHQTKRREPRTIYLAIYPVEGWAFGGNGNRTHLIEKWVKKNPTMVFVRNDIDIIYCKQLDSFWVGLPYTTDLTETLKNKLRTFLKPISQDDIIAKASEPSLKAAFTGLMVNLTQQLDNANQNLQTEFKKFNQWKAKILSKTDDNIVTEQLQAIHALPNVVKVYSDGHNLVVDTNHVYIKSNGITYHLGQYRISFPIGRDGLGNISITNITHGRRHRGMQHPHVHENGAPCLGEATTSIATFRRNFMLVEMVQTMIIYLHSVDINDNIGRDIVHWPIAQPYMTKEIIIKQNTSTNKWWYQFLPR